MIFVTKFVTENNFPIKTRKFVLEMRFFGTSRSLSQFISSKLLKFCKNHQNSTSIYRIFYRTFTVWYWISKSFLNCQTLESSLFNPLLDVQDLTCILSDSDLKIIKITNYRKNQIQNKENGRCQQTINGMILEDNSARALLDYLQFRNSASSWNAKFHY